jgi:hypothetical protein
VFRQREWSAVEHKYAFATVGAAEPQVLGECCTKSAAAYDYEIEGPKVSARRESSSGTSIWVDGDEHLVKGVTNIPSKNVTGEIGIGSGQTYLHTSTPRANEE